jgi:uncharacterized protein YfbU (UPF0304 family)
VCIAPKRWYLWDMQQTVLMLVLNGYSHALISRLYPPVRRTIGRWVAWLELEFLNHTHAIKEHFPDLGRYQKYVTFWPSCFKQMSLADAMFYVQQGGGSVP